MSKRRRKKQRPAARRREPSRSLSRGLAKVQELIDQDRWVEAAEELETLARRYPNDPQVFYFQSGVAAELHDRPGLMEAAQRWAALAPDNPEAILNLGGACLTNVRPAMARRVFRQFLERWPDHPRAADVCETLAELDESLPGVLSETGLAGLDQAEELAIWHEEAQVALEQNRFSEAISLEERILERVPTFASALNNISLAHFAEGRLDQAIVTARRVLDECDADNFHALANLIHFLCVAGRVDEARPFAERLKTVRSERVDIWVKKAEGLSYLGDDAGVLEVFAEAEAAGMLRKPFADPFLYHLAGVAAARLGHKREARRYWRQALKLQPNFSRAADNLADLRKPIGQRHGPWAFTLYEWLSPQTMQDMVNIVEPALRGKTTEKKVEQAARRFLAKHPEVIGLIPTLLERGDPRGREFAYHLARIAETPETVDALVNFALGQDGPDELRHEVAHFLADIGRLPRGQSVQMWMEGEQRELLLLGYTISDEPTTRLPNRVQRLMERARSAIYNRQLDEAERLLQQALEILPDHPSLLQNLAVVYGLRGDKEQVEVLIKQAVEIDPDYVIGRCQMASFAAEKGDLDEAEHWLEPIRERESFHTSEFAAFCQAHIDLELARGRLDAARSWLQMWEDVTPDHPHLPIWRDKLGPHGQPRLDQH